MHSSKLLTKYEKIYISTFFSFIASVETADLYWSPRMFEKNLNGPIGTLRGPGDTDSWKKLAAQNLVSDSL